MSIFDSDADLIAAIEELGPDEVLSAVTLGITKERGIVAAHHGDEYKSLLWADLSSALSDRNDTVMFSKVNKFVYAVAAHHKVDRGTDD